MTGADDAEKANRFLAWIERLKADMQIPRYIDPIRPQDEILGKPFLPLLSFCRFRRLWLRPRP